MTAYELYTLLQHNIDKQLVDPDDEVHIHMGHYSRSVDVAWAEDGQVHLSHNTPNDVEAILQHPEDEPL